MVFQWKKKVEATVLCSFPSELSPLRALIMAVVIVFKWDCTHTKLQQTTIMQAHSKLLFPFTITYFLLAAPFAHQRD